MRRLLLAVALAGGFLAVWCLGAPVGGREEPLLPELISLSQAAGVEVEGYELEGWAVIRDQGSPLEIWRRLDWERRLGLTGVKLRQQTARGAGLVVSSPAGGATGLRAVLQQVEQGKLCYLAVRVSLAGAGADGPGWEAGLREALAAASREHGLYVTLRGEFDRRLLRESQLAWSQAVFRELNGRATTTLQGGRYLCLNGYTPLLPEPARGSSQGEWNLSLALVNPAGSGATRVYLGSPVITGEY